MARPKKQEKMYVTDGSYIKTWEGLAKDLVGEGYDNGDIVNVYELVRSFRVKIEKATHIKAVDTKTKEVIIDEKVEEDC